MAEIDKQEEIIVTESVSLSKGLPETQEAKEVVESGRASQRKEPQEVSHQCSECSKVFKAKPKPKQHSGAQNLNQPTFCPTCSKTVLAELIDSIKNENIGRPVTSSNKTDLQTKAKNTNLKESRRFECRKCRAVFRQYNIYRVHLLSHSLGHLYRCNHCNEDFRLKTFLKKHLVDCAADLPFTCVRCGTGFSFPFLLKDHLLLHSKQQPLVCFVCLSPFIGRDELEEHLLQHVGEASYGCNRCDARFVELEVLKEHLLTHKDPALNILPNSPSSADLEEALTDEDATKEESESAEVKGGRMLRCVQCSQDFHNHNELNDHILSHREEGDGSFEDGASEASDKEFILSYRCPQCGDVFTSKEEIASHWASHCSEEKKEHKCPYCLKILCSASSLKRHMMIHSACKPFKCTRCSSSFDSDVMLNAHMMNHNEDLPFKCEVCQKGFKNSKSLKHHESIHNKKSPHKCGECDAEFIFKKDLRKHKKETHSREPPPHKCPHCKRAFMKEGTLSRHLIQNHNMNPLQCSQCHALCKDHTKLKEHMKVHATSQAITHPSGNSVAAPHDQNPSNSKQDVVEESEVKSTLQEEVVYSVMHLCSLCNQFFKDETELQLHQEMHIATQALAAAQQLSKTQLENQKEEFVGKHFNEVGVLTLHQCQLCLSLFKDDVSLKEHIKVQHTPPPGVKTLVIVQSPGKSSISSKEENVIKLAHDHYIIKTLHQCSICRASFADASVLQQHAKIHSEGHQKAPDVGRSEPHSMGKSVSPSDGRPNVHKGNPKEGKLKVLGKGSPAHSGKGSQKDRHSKGSSKETLKVHGSENPKAYVDINFKSSEGNLMLHGENTKVFGVGSTKAVDQKNSAASDEGSPEIHSEAPCKDEKSKIHRKGSLKSNNEGGPNTVGDENSKASTKDLDKGNLKVTDEKTSKIHGERNPKASGKRSKTSDTSSPKSQSTRRGQRDKSPKVGQSHEGMKAHNQGNQKNLNKSESMIASEGNIEIPNGDCSKKQHGDNQKLEIGDNPCTQHKDSMKVERNSTKIASSSDNVKAEKSSTKIASSSDNVKAEKSSTKIATSSDNMKAEKSSTKIASSNDNKKAERNSTKNTPSSDKQKSNKSDNSKSNDRDNPKNLGGEYPKVNRDENHKTSRSDNSKSQSSDNSKGKSCDNLKDKNGDKSQSQSDDNAKSHTYGNSKKKSGGKSKAQSVGNAKTQNDDKKKTHKCQSGDNSEVQINKIPDAQGDNKLDVSSSRKSKSNDIKAKNGVKHKPEGNHKVRTLSEGNAEAHPNLEVPDEDKNEGNQQMPSGSNPEKLVAGDSNVQSNCSLKDIPKTEREANEKGLSDDSAIQSDCNQKGYTGNNLEGERGDYSKEQTGDNPRVEKEEDKICSTNLRLQDSGSSKLSNDRNPKKEERENLKAHSEDKEEKENPKAHSEGLETSGDGNPRTPSPKNPQIENSENAKSHNCNSTKAQSNGPKKLNSPKVQSSVILKDTQSCSKAKVHDGDNPKAGIDCDSNIEMSCDDNLKEVTSSNVKVEAKDNSEMEGEGKEKVESNRKMATSVKVKNVTSPVHPRTKSSDQTESKTRNVCVQKSENLVKQNKSSLVIQSGTDPVAHVENDAGAHNIDTSVQSGDIREQNGGCMKGENSGTVEIQDELRQQQNPEALPESPSAAARLNMVQVDSQEIKQSSGEQTKCGAGPVESSVNEEPTLSTCSEGEFEGEMAQDVNKKSVVNMDVQEGSGNSESCLGSSKQQELPEEFHGTGAADSCSQEDENLDDDDDLKSHVLIHSGEKPFKCKYCWRTFSKLHIMKGHMRKHPMRKAKYKCIECGRFCGSPLALNNHRKTHKSEVEHECETCQVKFSSLVELESHKLVHISVGSFKCSKCDAIFESSDKLSEHEVVHSNEKPFTCPVCKNTFRHSSRQLFICPVCNKIPKHKVNPKSPSSHKLTQDGQGLMRCKICNTFYKARVDLARHYWNKHSDMRYKCGFCPMSFRTKRGLMKHKLLHSKDKKAKLGAHPTKTRHQELFCLVCSASFATMKLLKEHRQMHNEKPYKCAHCDASFWTTVGLKRHNSTHYSLSYRCPSCEKFFPSKRQLRWHEAAHNAKLHTCYLCGEEFNTMRHLTKHLQIHSADTRPKSPVIGTRPKPEKHSIDVDPRCLREVQICLKRIKPNDHPNVDFNIDPSQFKDEVTDSPIVIVSALRKNKSQIDGDNENVSASVDAFKECTADDTTKSTLTKGRESKTENISLDDSRKEQGMHLKGDHSSRSKDEVDQSHPSPKKLPSRSRDSSPKKLPSRSRDSTPKKLRSRSRDSTPKKLPRRTADSSPKKLPSSSEKVCDTESKKFVVKNEKVQKSLANDCSVTAYSVEAIDNPGKLSEAGRKVVSEEASSDKDHVELQVKTALFECPKCDAVFNQYAIFTQHLMTHKDLHKFNCSICSTSFKFRSLMKKHMLEHASEMPFSCLRCEAKFSYAFLLKDHLMTHTSGPLLACFHCDAPFILTKELDEHILMHVGAEYLICHLCGEKLPDVEMLRNHVASHESGLVTKDNVDNVPGAAVKPLIKKNSSTDVKACSEPLLKEKKEDTLVSEGEVPKTTDSNHNEKTQTPSQPPVQQIESEGLEHSTKPTISKPLEQSDQTDSKHKQEKTVFRRIDKKDAGAVKHLEHMTVFRCASPNDSAVSKMRDNPNVTVFRPIEQKGYILSKLYEDSSKTVFKCVEQPKNDGSKTKDQFTATEQSDAASSTVDNVSVKDNKTDSENVGIPVKGIEQQDSKGRYKCMECFAFVSSQEELKGHMLIHKDAGDTNIVVKADYSSSISRYVCVNYRCPQCAEVFSTKNDLVSHWAIHCSDEDDENKCPHCGKILSSTASLKRHMQTHKEVKTHKCPQCPKSFSSEFALKNHMMLHSKPLPFKCTHCEKQFSTASYLTSHLNTHLKERSHKCTKCSADFLYKKDLKLHMKTHMQDLPFKCTHCHKAFTLEKSLKRHLTRTHGIRSPVPCRYCGATFLDHADLKDHVKGHKPGFFCPSAVTKEHNARVGETIADYNIMQEGDKAAQTISALHSVELVSKANGGQRVETVSRGAGDDHRAASDEVSISVKHEGEDVATDSHSEMSGTRASDIIDHLGPPTYVEDHAGPIDVIAGSPISSLLTTSHIETVVTDGVSYEDNGMIPVVHSDNAPVVDVNRGDEVAIASSDVDSVQVQVCTTDENALLTGTAGHSNDDCVDEISDGGILRNALGSNVVIESTVSLAQPSTPTKTATPVSLKSYSRSEMKKKPLEDQSVIDNEAERESGSIENPGTGGDEEAHYSANQDLMNKEEAKQAKESKQKQRDVASFKEIKVKIMNPDGKCLESVILVPCASQSSQQEIVTVPVIGLKEMQKKTHPCGLCKAEFSTDNELEDHFAVHLVEVKDLATFESKEEQSTHTTSMPESIPGQNSVSQAMPDNCENVVLDNYTDLVSTSHIDVPSSSHADVTLSYSEAALITFNQDDGNETQTNRTSVNAMPSNPQTLNKIPASRTSSDAESDNRADTLQACYRSERKVPASCTDVKITGHANKDRVSVSHITEGKVSGKDVSRNVDEKVLTSHENIDELPTGYVSEVKSSFNCPENSQVNDGKIMETLVKDGKATTHGSDIKVLSSPVDMKVPGGCSGQGGILGYDTTYRSSENKNVVPAGSVDVPSTYVDSSQVSSGHADSEDIFNPHMTNLNVAVISAEGDVVQAAIEMSDAAATLASIASDTGIPSQGANVVVQTNLPQVSQEPLDLEFHGEEKSSRSLTMKRMSADALLDEDATRMDLRHKRFCHERREKISVEVIKNKGEDVKPKEDNMEFSHVTALKSQVATHEGNPTDNVHNVSEFQYHERDAVFANQAVQKEVHRLYSCSQCQAKFSTEAALKTHEVIHVENLYRCSQCDISFTKQRDLTEHMQHHKGKRNHKCLQCGKAFYSANLLKTHMLIHARKDEFNLTSRSVVRPTYDVRSQGSESFLSSDDPDDQPTAKPEDVSVQCPQCDKVLKDAADLLYHISTHDGRKPHQCCQCDKAFRFPDELRKHLGVIHRMKDPFYCSECSEAFVSIYQLKEHMIVHRKKQNFSCTECNATFRMRSSLKKHKLYHNGERPHKCATCHLSFQSHSVLQSHIITHTTIKPYKCSLCDKSYSKTKELRLHIMEHTGERPVKCPHCEKSVRNISALRYHLRTHEGKCPCKCPYCNKAYRLPQQLKKHLTQVHKTSSLHQCPECSEYFVSRFKMKEHFRTHREGHLKGDQRDTGFSTPKLEMHEQNLSDQQHQCPKCESSFSLLSDLKAHMSMHKELYICPYCASVDIELHSFNAHVQSHIVGKLYQCIKCEQSFSHPEELKTHMTTHQMEEPSDSGQSENVTSIQGWDSKRSLSGQSFKCVLCSSSFISRTELKAHQAVHKGCFKCSSCGAVFHELAALCAHLQIHPTTSLYQCAICDKLFSQANSIEAHVAIHEPNQSTQHSQSETMAASYDDEPMMEEHIGESIKCPQCNKLVKIDNLPQHVLLHSGDHPHECCECSEAFHLTSQLKRHLELVHKISNPHHCSQCTRTFASFYQLRDHHMIHEEKQEYLCVDCDASFNDLANLNRHKMYHIGEHPHKCLSCQLTFEDVNIFQGHIVGHAEERPFHCLQCKQECLSLWDLKIHMIEHRSQQSQQSIKCPHCPKSLVGLSDLKHHLLVHRDKPQQECSMNPFQCSECLEYFASQQELKDHERIHHKVPHQCLHCHETLHTLDQVRAHKRLHSNLHPHQCSRCDSSFTHQSELQAHAAAHQDYKCAHCKESFKSKEDVKKHLLMRAHNKCPSHREVLSIKGVVSPREKLSHVEETRESEGHGEKLSVKIEVAAEEVTQTQHPVTSLQSVHQEVAYTSRERTNLLGEEHSFAKEDPTLIHPHEYCYPINSVQVGKQGEISTSSVCATPTTSVERSQVYKERRHHLTHSRQDATLHHEVDDNKDVMKDIVMFGDTDESRNEVVIHFYE
ncbi:uncharacterized protein LOC143037022 isoform X2 [Oratosquilla oratoria]|uniref:uncharacterized protein LOC143037022 isoform X2 n=1 Tax=Oratosquilla oratoria TaxID=337810 RepID=UPI003F75836B